MISEIIMAKATRRTRRRRVHSSRRMIRARPYKSQPSNRLLVKRNVFPEDCSKCVEKRDSWENVICSVCMECPHNAVLLLCSSHDKGCRPYMCGTSFRYSNCLDQYKKASAKLGNLTCPLCRGQVKGWTVVQTARDHLNLKKRICMQEECVFAGTFGELRKHMRVEHPCARPPREVDPEVEQNWRRLEIEHDRDDVFSTIRSLIPGATVFGDYVIERNDDDDDDGGNGSDSDEGGGGGDQYNGSGMMDAGFGRNFLNVILMMHAVGASRSQTRRSDSDSSDLTTINRGTADEMTFSGEEEEEDRQSTSLASRMRRQGRVLLGRSGRRRRDREANQRPGPPPR